MARKQHKYHYIYKTTCKVNGKFYVGMHSTSNLDDEYLGSGKRLGYSVRKHGKENHKREILEFLSDRSSLKVREKELVNEDLLKDPMCMNLRIGGVGGFIDVEHMKKCSAAGNKAFSDKIKNDSDLRNKFISLGSNNLKKAWKEGKINMKGENNPRYGKSLNNETKSKIGKSSSIHQSGKGNSQYGTLWIIHKDLGKKKIKKEELESFLKENWLLGRKIKN